MDRAPRTVLVAGGAGGVGEGIVRALLVRTSAHVIVTSRDEARLALLERRLGVVAEASRLTGIVGDAGDAGGAEAIRDRVRERAGTIDVAIPSLGGWWEGALLDADAATWAAVMHEMLGTHFLFARTFVPELERTGGWYLAIGGGAAYFPVPRSSLVSIAAAGQLMLTRALLSETAGRGVRITELIVNGPVRTRDSDAIAGSDWITADEVGEVVAELVRDGRTSWSPLRCDGPFVVMDPCRRVKVHGETVQKQGR